MIDEAVLEDLFAQAADSLAIPDDGPARVLQERDDRSRQPRGRSNLPVQVTQRRAAGLVAAAAVVAIVAVTALHLSGGGGGHVSASNLAQSSTGSGSASGGVTNGADSAATPAAAGASPGASTGAGAGGGTSATAGSSGVATPTLANGPDQVPPAQTKVIKTATVSVQVAAKGLMGAMNRLNTIAAGQGGFIQTSGTNSTSTGQPANGSATLRVPVANFATALNQVEALGTTTSATTSGQDVTSQYVDLQARLQSLQDTRTQFQLILAHAQSIPDILSVEQQISAIQTQIEQLQGQLNVMNDQTSFSTITATLSEPGSAVTPQAAPRHLSGVSKAWAHAHRSFTNGVESVLAASGGVAVFLLFAGIALLVVRLAWAPVRRRLL